MDETGNAHGENLPGQAVLVGEFNFSQAVYTTAILPELLGKIFHGLHSTKSHVHRPKLTVKSRHQQNNSKTFCYCDGPDEGQMVGYDNLNCKYQWFHLECLGLKSEPKSKHWNCPCRLQKTSDKKCKKKCTVTLIYIFLLLSHFMILYFTQKQYLLKRNLLRRYYRITHIS